MAVCYFEGTENVHCYTSCTLTTLHCSEESFIQCCHIKIYNKIFTKMGGVYSLLWDFSWDLFNFSLSLSLSLYIYIYVYIWNMKCEGSWPEMAHVPLILSFYLSFASHEPLRFWAKRPQNDSHKEIALRTVSFEGWLSWRNRTWLIFTGCNVTCHTGFSFKRDDHTKGSNANLMASFEIKASHNTVYILFVFNIWSW